MHHREFVYDDPSSVHDLEKLWRADEDKFLPLSLYAEVY
jgi:hypothetical protein